MFYKLFEHKNKFHNFVNNYYTLDRDVSFKATNSKNKNMKRLLFVLICFCFGMYVSLSAQNRDYQLRIEVQSETGESFNGVTFLLEIPSWGFKYSHVETRLSDDGTCQLNVYGATHHIVIQYPGLQTYDETFEVTGDMDLKVTLKEDVKKPFSLNAQLEHNPVDGQNDVLLTWNREAPAFFDDFDSYPDWAINFGDWTGIDVDQQAAVVMEGSYPNRGSLQYATIVNPLTVVPTWWYSYPVLRPYSGNQYVGFVRTQSGDANDDWLISPVINVGTDNILRFMAKAADVYPERFQVAITTAENPEVSDFTVISQGNYETVDYTQWVAKEYDLSEYAGQAVRIAIHYMSDTNRYGAFMLMVDDFYVGQPDTYNDEQMRKACRVQKSPANPYEKFEIYLDGSKVGETESYSYRFENVAEGDHQFGVKAVYRMSETEMSTYDLAVSNENCHRVELNVSANNEESVDGIAVEFLDMSSGETSSYNVADGKVVLGSLPAQTYNVSIKSALFDEYQEELVVNGDITKSIELKEHLFLPYNITVDLTESGDTYDAKVKWNQDLGFSDSFEDYEDFVSGSFGGWQTIDNDQLPVYPIGLGSTSNIVSFPGSGDAYNPTAIPPMVFNPYKTVPAMAPDDSAIIPPTGEKSIIFFSPQMATADKWLISPAQEIREGYVWTLSAKAYTIYPEIVRFCVSTSPDISSFTVLDEVELPYDQWTVYSLDLSDYVGQTVYLAVNYVSTDAFLAQVDDFYVGPGEDSESAAEVGKVLRYDVYLDSVLKGSSETAEFTLTGISAGTHTVGVKAVYKTGESEMAEYQFSTDAGVSSVADTSVAVVGLDGEMMVRCDEAVPFMVSDMSGRIVKSANLEAGVHHISVSAGVYIAKVGERVFKVLVR